jgi:hypothetical protein
MYSKDLTSAAQEIEEHFEGLKRVAFQELAEKARLYPDGFEFYYPSTSIVDGVLDKSCITKAFIDPERLDDVEVWYYCNVPSWTPGADECMPLSESAISRAIAKFGTPKQEA